MLALLSVNYLSTTTIFDARLIFKCRFNDKRNRMGIRNPLDKAYIVLIIPFAESIISHSRTECSQRVSYVCFCAKCMSLVLLLVRRVQLAVCWDRNVTFLGEPIAWLPLLCKDKFYLSTRLWERPIANRFPNAKQLETDGDMHIYTAGDAGNRCRQNAVQTITLGK